MKSLLHRGWQNAEGKGARSQVGWPEFDAWDPRGRRREPTSTTVLWPSPMYDGMHTWCTQTCTHDRKINEWFCVFKGASSVTAGPLLFCSLSRVPLERLDFLLS